MTTEYTVKYKVPGQIFWRNIRRVIGDGIEPGMFRWFATADDEMVYIPLDSQVWFPKERRTSILAAMSKEAGQQVV